jgi:hypothetical protein
VETFEAPLLKIKIFPASNVLNCEGSDKLFGELKRQASGHAPGI